MCIHCKQKQLKAVNSLLGTLFHGEESKARIDDLSTTKSWGQKPPQTPYFDYDKLEKRVDRNQSKLAKVFKQWEKRFNENYKEARSASFSLLAFFKQEDLSLEEWQKVVAVGTITSPQEMNEVLIGFVGEEVVISANEISENIFNLQGIVTESITEPPRDVMDFLEIYEFNLSESTASQVDQRLKNIVVNGIANGDSTPEIARQIRSSFKTLESSKAQLIARTETIRASAEGSKTAYRRAGIAQVALLPAVTACPICMAIAAENPYSTDDNTVYPPIHPNCRCTVIPVFDSTDVDAISSGVVNANSF